jgi:hypothetical protein
MPHARLLDDEGAVLRSRYDALMKREALEKRSTGRPTSSEF